jgi:Protein of unknown function (DUF3072)
MASHTPRKKKTRPRRPAPILDTGPGRPMTAEQARLLRRLARDCYEPDAFSTQLTRAEAERRIAMLKAKIELQGEPPHPQ